MPLDSNNPLKKPIILSKLLCIILVLILILGNVFFAVKYFNTKSTLEQTQEIVESQDKNNKTLVFARLFIEKVLRAENEVDFETRLEMENAVRNLNDEEILGQWQRFTESKTESQAQEEVKNLLGMLINKI